MEFRYVGEYHYMKALWALNEALVATLNVYERTGAEWPPGTSTCPLNEKFSQKRRGLPDYMLFAHRRIDRAPARGPAGQLSSATSIDAEYSEAAIRMIARQ